MTHDMHAGTWSVNDTSATCGVCHDSGIKGYYYLNGNPTTPAYIPCDCVAVVQQRAQASGNLAQLADKTFATFIAFPLIASHVDRCRDYAADPRGWLLLHGSYGTGKSHLAAAIANAVIARGGYAQFYAVPDLLDSLRETFDRRADESFSERFNRIRNAPLLVLDDAGTEKLTDWAKEKHFQLINHRYNCHLPTVFTTNEPLSRFDGRIESRLSDVVLCDHLDFRHAADYRKLGLRERKAA